MNYSNTSKRTNTEYLSLKTKTSNDRQNPCAKSKSNRYYFPITTVIGGYKLNQSRATILCSKETKNRSKKK